MQPRLLELPADGDFLLRFESQRAVAGGNMSDRYLLPRRQLRQVGGGEAQIDSLDIGGRNRLQPTIELCLNRRQSSMGFLLVTNYLLLPLSLLIINDLHHSHSIVAGGLPEIS